MCKFVHKYHSILIRCRVEMGMPNKFAPVEVEPCFGFFEPCAGGGIKARHDGIPIMGKLSRALRCIGESCTGVHSGLYSTGTCVSSLYVRLKENTCAARHLFQYRCAIAKHA
jgi:hypothetical protein